MVGHNNLPRFENLESRLLLSAWWSGLIEAFASAEPVEVGVLGRTTADGQVEAAGEQRLYKFTAAANGRMHIDLAADESGLDPYLEVFHSSGWRYGVNDNASAETLDSSVTLYSVYAGDTYYIRASGVGETLGDFDLSVTSDPTDDIGNTFENAQELHFWRGWGSASAYAGGTVNYAGDVDMMSFVASESGLVTVKQAGWGYWGIPGLAGKVTAYDAGGNLLATSADDGGDASMEFRVVAGQRYYTGFAGVGGATGYYSASLLTIPEPFASAEVFDLGALDVETLSGTLAQAGETKAYRFTAAAAGRVRIDLAADDGDLDPYLKLYRSPSWSWASMQNDNAASGTHDSSLLLYYVQPGDTYYVVASGADDTAGAYTLTVTSEPFDDHTNTLENARTIGLWGTWAYGAGYGQINYAGDVDVMAFVAPGTGRAYVEQGTWWGSSTSHAVTVYDADGNQLASDDAADDSQARVSFRVVGGQTYYVECGSVGDWTGWYQVKVNTVPEPFASAEILDLGTLDVETVSGVLAEAGETIGYQFTAAGAGQIRFNLAADGDALDPSLKLYSSAGYCIGQNDNAAADTRDSSLLLYYVQPGQTYYAVVSGAADTAGAYTLTVGSSPVDDMGNTLALAARTTLSAYAGGSTVWGQIGYADDVDVISFVATHTGLMHIDQIPWGRLDTFAGRLTAYDTDGNVLTHVDGDAGAAASLDFRVVSGRTYSVEIASAGGWTGWYRAQMTTVPEPFASAEVFDLGVLDVQTLSGTLAEAGQTKAYRFTTAAAGQVRINLAADDGDLDPYLKLYRSPSWSWASMQNDNAASDTHDSSLLLYYVQPGDTYYLVASGAADTAGAFTLTVGSSPYDDMGNALALAARTTLDPNTGGAACWGQIGYADDVDLMSLVATQTGVMHIDQTPWGYSGGFSGKVTVYDADGTELAQDADASDAAATVSLSVTDGRAYYVAFEAMNGATGWYRVQVTTEEAPPPAPDPVPPDGGEYTPGVIVLAHVLGEGASLRLIVVGTDSADTITLSQAINSITLTTPLGATTYCGSFSATVVYGFGGADTIRLSHTVTAASQVFGGSGDDQLFEAGPGEGWTYGQEGDDLLVTVGGGADRVWGGIGLDSFWTDGADTLEDVETAETLAASVHQITAFYQPTSNPAEHVSLEIRGQDIVDPQAGSAYYDHSYRPLFVDGPEYNDIRQGSVGDCYFLASLASLADTDPGVIRQMIAPMGDGTYAVRYHRSGQPVYVRVDAELPGSSISPRYAKFTPDGELWVALAEKAYAQFRRGENSYASISGGWMDPVYREVTNSATTRLWPTSSAVATAMADHLAAGHALTAASPSNPPGPIVGLHAYMVKSVEIEGGDTLVTVYNPWGFDGKLYDGNSGDGLLTLTLATFRQNFSAVVVSLA